MGVFVVRLNVGQALADCTLYGAIGASRIIDPKRGAVGLAQVELGKVAVQMLLADTAALSGAGADRTGDDPPPLAVADRAPRPDHSQ